jgi:hypothetical protein
MNEAAKRDLPDAIVRYVDTGHFGKEADPYTHGWPAGSRRRRHSHGSGTNKEDKRRSGDRNEGLGNASRTGAATLTKEAAQSYGDHPRAVT